MENTIKILFFGLFKDIMGKKEFTLTIENKISFKAFLQMFGTKFDQFNKILQFIEDKEQKQPVFVMVNGESIKKPFEIEIGPEFEIAFLPPVGGG